MISAMSVARRTFICGFWAPDWKKYLQRKISIVSIVAVLALAAVLPAGTAESPGDPKRAAFDVVERNAEEIATVGDVLYYYRRTWDARV